MKKRRLLVIFKPHFHPSRDEKILPHLLKQIQTRNLPFALLQTTREMNAEKLVRKYLSSGHTDVVIVGGDGTISDAVNGLMTTPFAKKVSVGVIPHGTGNDFYRMLCGSKKLENQIEQALSGKIQKIDLGECNSRIFVNGVGIGFDGKVGEFKSQRPGAGILVYLWGVLTLLFRYPGFHLKKQNVFKNLALSKKILTITIGNGHSFGGGFKLTPKANIKDGKLDICLMTKRNVFYNLLNLSRLKSGSHLVLPITHYRQMESLELESEEPLPIHIDGEIQIVKKIKISLSKKKLLVRMGTGATRK